MKIGKIGNKNIYFLPKIESETFKTLLADDLIKIAFLSVVAGYEKTNDVFLFLEKKLPERKKSLENFLSYILNDRYFAPIKFKIQLHILKKQVGKEKKDNIKHEYNKLILFSGGFDTTSTLLYALDQGWDPMLLWIDFGQKNAKSEEKTVKKIAKKLDRNLIIIRINLKRYVEKGWKDWSYIVPARNFMFAAFGAFVLSFSNSSSNYLMLGVPKEEYYHPDPCVDKSPYFFRFNSKLFTKFYNKKIKLISPIKSFTKTELVAHWKNVWLKKYKIHPFETTSCYFGIKCGICNACVKRCLSFLAGGLELEPGLKRNPFHDENLVEVYIRRCFEKVGNKTKFPKEKALDVLLALKRVQSSLSNGIKKLLKKVLGNVEENLLKREKYLKNFSLENLENKKKKIFLYVVRHGETEENSKGILLGRKEAMLNDKGKKEAHSLGKKLQKEKIDIIFSSHLKRAQQTAEIISQYLKKPIKLDKRLMERNLGIFEGLSKKEFFEKFQKGFDSEMAYHSTPPEGESTKEVQKRVFSFLEEIKKNYSNKKILIVTHSFVSKMINKYFHPELSAKEFFSFQLKNGKIKKFKL